MRDKFSNSDMSILFYSDRIVPILSHFEYHASYYVLIYEVIYLLENICH